MKLISISSIALALITVLITIVFFAWWMFKDPVMFGSEKFDQVGWMQSVATINTDCKRGDMAYDLQKNILSKGVKRDAVMALLGRPSYEEKNVIEYDLGKCMHVYHGLLVFFDDNNNLVRSRISSH
ncbi:MAG: hypothetical protein WBL28_06300 [Methylotenera sp.]